MLMSDAFPVVSVNCIFGVALPHRAKARVKSRRAISIGTLRDFCVRLIGEDRLLLIILVTLINYHHSTIKHKPQLGLGGGGG